MMPIKTIYFGAGIAPTTTPAFTVCLALLYALASPAALAAANAEQSSTSIFAAYSTAHEVTVAGAIQRIVSTKSGTHIFIAGSSGSVEASLSSITRATTFV
jgi:hypothetical protein